ncbi:MAG: ABC transporter permease subunit, partial [Myxococcota bacterium]|nr:ABC transporter permease subunit [Myxococcota bacterium]
MASLPALGLWFVYQQPPGLLLPPPLDFGQLPALVAKTLGLAITVSIGALINGSWLAWTVSRHAFRGRRVVAALTVMTLATPSYLMAAIVRESFAPAGLLGAIFGLNGQFTGFWPAAVVLTIACTPYVYILMRAAFQECPPAEEEAARCL